MKKTDTHAFANQLLVCLLMTFGFGGSIGLGTVWMRHQISITANENRRLAAEFDDLGRRLATKISLVESEQVLEVLRQRNAAMRVGLVPVSEAQTQFVTEDPVQRLRVRNNRELFQGVVTSNFRVAIGR